MPFTPRVTSSLAYWSTRTPSAVALECAGESLTWRDLATSVETLASGLHRDGVRRGDRIGYLTENSIGTIETILAALILDAVVVPLNVRLTTPELAWIAEDADLAAVLGDSRHRAQIAGLRAARPRMRVYWTGPDAPAWARPLDAVHVPGEVGRRGPVTSDTDRLAFLCYTSGTTGRPKGAMLTHGNVLAAAQAFALTEGLTRHDSSLLVLPLAFTGSLMATWMPVYFAGARFVLHPRFSARDTLNELSLGRISVFYAVPFVFEELARLDGFDTADLSAVRVAKAGGAPASPAVLARYAARGIPIGQGYGMTESTGVGVSLPREDFERKAGFTGITNFGIELRLVDDHGNDCAPGEIGEVWLRGPSVMAGYWGDREGTAEALAGGWLRTGDLGMRDAEEFIKIVGRAKDMVLSGGLNVYPGEIERVLALVPGVHDVAVVGIPDQRWGEVPVAVVVVGPGVPAERLAEACRAELADYKVPKRFVLRDEPLPRTMSGKVAKAELRDALVAAPGAS